MEIIDGLSHEAKNRSFSRIFLHVIVILLTNGM